MCKKKQHSQKSAGVEKEKPRRFLRVPPVDINHLLALNDGCVFVVNPDVKRDILRDFVGRKSFGQKQICAFVY